MQRSKCAKNINCGDIFVLTTQSILYAKICMKEEWQMTIEELAREYEQQYDRLNEMDEYRRLKRSLRVLKSYTDYEEDLYD